MAGLDERARELAGKLKPCPWCGGDADIEHDDEFAVWRAFCTKCGCFGPFVDDVEPQAETAARSRWNTRALAQQDDLRAMLVRCRNRFLELDDFWNGICDLAETDDPRPSKDRAMADEIDRTLGNALAVRDHLRATSSGVG